MSYLYLIQCLLVGLLHIKFTSSIKQKIRIYALPADYAYSQDIIPAQQIALDIINNDSSILPNYTLSYHKLKYSNSTAIALNEVLDITKSHRNSLFNATDDSYTFPFLLGPPFSSYSTVTAPAANAFGWSLMSSAATAVSLSNTALFPKYYRTIPNDYLNIKGVMNLCLHFNWTSIAVVYTADIYGIYFANGLLEEASKKNIHTNLVTYGRNVGGYKYAVETLKKLDTYIVVLITHPDEAVDLFQELQKESMTSFPYFYVGVNSWFDTGSIINNNFEKYCKGFIGATPWIPENVISDEIFKNLDLIEIYNQTQIFNEKFRKLWDALQDRAKLTSFSYYGWDSMFTLAQIMHKFDEMFDLSKSLNMSNVSWIGAKVQEILINEIDFPGLTGHIAFDDNGERVHGLYSYCNVIDDKGNIECFGIVSDDFNVILSENITWPDEFVRYGIIPRSHKILTERVVSIDRTIGMVMMILSIISIVIALVYIVLLCINRNDLVIKSIAWKLNLITCIGCIIAYIDVIVYWQEADVNIICNLREWLMVISFTLTFMPLFFKTYRLSIIFTGMLEIRTLPDYKLMLGVLICFIIDITLLSIFTALDPDVVTFIKGDIISLHGLEDQQITYQACYKKDHVMQVTFYAVLGVWKVVEGIFGVYAALILSRIGFQQVNRYRETESQLIAILFTGTILILAAIVVFFIGNTSDDAEHHGETGFYIIVGVVAILCGNFILHSSMLWRFVVVYHKEWDHTQLERNEQQSMQDLIKTRMRTATKIQKLYGLSKRRVDSNSKHQKKDSYHDNVPISLDSPEFADTDRQATERLKMTVEMIINGEHERDDID